jgi:hypothetical protein
MNSPERNYLPGDPNTDHHLEEFVLFCFSLPRNVLPESLPSNGLFRAYSLQRERVFGEQLANNGPPLWLHYSGFQAVLTEPLPSNDHIRHSIPPHI